MRLALPLALLALACLPSNSMAQEAAGASLWRAQSRDNICVVSNPRQVNNPAVVSYKDVLLATPEMRDLRTRGISPQSAEGQILRERAVDHVRRVCSRVMGETRHCSMWKKISHRGGRPVSDLTNRVVSTLSMSTVAMGMNGGAMHPGSEGSSSGVVFAGDSASVAPPQSDSETGGDGSMWIGFAVVLVLAAAWIVGRKRSSV